MSSVQTFLLWSARLAGFTTGFPRYDRQSLSFTVVLGVLLSGCGGKSSMAGISGTPAASEFTFQQYEVAIGTAQHQTVLTGFLLAGALAELAVISIDDNDDRCLRIFAFSEDAWVPRLEATLRPEVMFVDVANIGGRDRLITYEGGWLNWFDPESATERALVAVTPNFNPPRRGAVPHVDVTRDLNSDNRDDLVVPDVDAFWVFIQMSDGTFADPVKIGLPTETGRLYDSEGYRHDPWSRSRVHAMDYNRDGLADLAFWNEDHFEVHLQDTRGLFAPVATTFTTEVEFDSDDLSTLAAPQGVRHRRMDHEPTGALTGRVLHSLADLNGDGVADLAVFSLKGGSLWRMHSTYEVHFGQPTLAGGTVFAPDVGTAIPSDGIPFGLVQHDFDHNGQVDMMFTIINPGIFKAIGMLIDSLLTDSVSMDLDFYGMKGGFYPDRPNATRKIKAHSFGKTGDKASLFPSVLIGDVNGDRRSDLLVQKGRKELRVFLGTTRPELFVQRPLKVAVAMPNEEYTWLVDLDKDGKQDIIMHLPSTTASHRVTMLIAR